MERESITAAIWRNALATGNPLEKHLRVDQRFSRTQRSSGLNRWRNKHCASYYEEVKERHVKDAALHRPLSVVRPSFEEQLGPDSQSWPTPMGRLKRERLLW